MPTFNVSAPIIIIALLIILTLGSVGTYLVLSLTGSLAQPVDTPIPTITRMPTASPTLERPTFTASPLPSPTPLSYTVKPDDSCLVIAYAFNISVPSIITENGLSADCLLSVGTVLRIPQPTPTATPLATNTPSSQQATIEACQKTFYVVKENETLGQIAAEFEVPVETIMEWSGKTVDTAFYGETLTIPLCLRSSVAGSTVTPSPAPDYPAPELLRPRNGEAFTLNTDSITLQWAAVSDLRENEYYLVTLINLTSGQNEELTVAVKDTKYLVPNSLRPTTNIPNIFQWYVIPAAQIGVDQDGNPEYRHGGPPSDPSYFTWVGSSVQATP